MEQNYQSGMNQDIVINIDSDDERNKEEKTKMTKEVNIAFYSYLDALIVKSQELRLSNK